MKHCPRCNQDLPLSEFFINRAKKDGRTVYCKPCHTEIVKRSRQSKQEMKHVKRKACELVRPIWKLNLSAREKVRVAYARGLTDRMQIRRATRILMNELVDIIAELNDSGIIKWNREEKRFQLAA